MLTLWQVREECVIVGEFCVCRPELPDEWSSTRSECFHGGEESGGDEEAPLIGLRHKY